MKFLSYNLRNGSIREERNTDVWNNWQHRREAVLDVIRKADADIIALQEDTNEQVDFILRGLQGSHRSFRDPAYYEADLSNNALLVRNGIEVSAHEAFWISSDGKTQTQLEGSICMRHATYARLQLTGGALLVVDVHLDHSEDQDFKRREVHLFTGHLSAVCGRPPARTIVTGDFNSVPELPAYRAMHDFGLHDAAPLKGDERPTAIHWAAAPAFERIDYVWLSDDLKDALAGYDVLSGTYQRRDGSPGHASDHCAVLAQVHL